MSIEPLRIHVDDTTEWRTLEERDAAVSQQRSPTVARSSWCLGASRPQQDVLSHPIPLMALSTRR